MQTTPSHPAPETAFEDIELVLIHQAVRAAEIAHDQVSGMAFVCGDYTVSDRHANLTALCAEICDRVSKNLSADVIAPVANSDAELTIIRGALHDLRQTIGAQETPAIDRLIARIDAALDLVPA